ncbi:tRNA lysidine(34) synthetase TilS [Pelolinea submarina]|uniref:tRNA(Ile)-lysidine synthase n=1 Tax=Pelolinea submarina TaxID=913107 RepID=A0A347ZSP0_9CHLR|nr:tRNA lysidine(34) synthetase TilS [Pelolinea submarina]REG11106.1 tRNA(Ile)-lysidine synthase [Pelolinea submarina]BBB48321.1 tRNA(Ile)-lysidine synthase [Pelolinea submarina]
MLLEKVKATLQNSCYIQPQDTLVMGVSGGADSMTLLDILVRSGYKPVVAHFNHQLRPEAAADAEFVRRRAGEYGLEFALGSADVALQARQNSQSIEEAARGARYRFLFGLAEQRQAVALVVAHQADDQVETVLLNLLRGSGLKGLSAMRFQSFSPFHESIPLVRPMLGCWRDEIQLYCSDHKLPFVCDETNQDSTYRRNRIRLELLPELESYNPQIKRSLFQMADLLAGDMDFINAACRDAAAQVALQTHAGYAEMELREFRHLSVALQRALIRSILADAFPQAVELGAYHFELARRCLTREMESLNVQLNDAILVRVESGRGVFMRTESAMQPSSEWPAIENEIHILPETGTIELACGWELSLEMLSKDSLGDAYLSNTDNFCAYLASEKLASDLLLRTWQDGDRYQPLGLLKGQQKLSDFWINNKVPLRAKGHWPLLFSGGNLVWVPGFPPSQLVKVSSETQNVLKARVSHRENYSSVI